MNITPKLVIREESLTYFFESLLGNIKKYTDCNKEFLTNCLSNFSIKIPRENKFSLNDGDVVEIQILTSTMKGNVACVVMLYFKITYYDSISYSFIRIDEKLEIIK